MADTTKLFDDGMHFVREATRADKHPLRFVIRSAKGAPVTTMRRAGSLADAIAIARRATEQAQASKGVPKQRKPRPAKKAVKPTLATFSTVNFTCVRANPVAQVWRCDHLPNEKNPDKRRPVKHAYDHVKGEFAVLMWKEPVRTPDGKVRVYRTIAEAENHAFDLYHADEESIGWHEDSPVVATTYFCDILFQPDAPEHTEARPFSVWIRTPFNKPIYAERRPARYNVVGKKVQGGNIADETKDADAIAAIEAAKRLKAIETEELHGKALSDRPKLFATIWGAFEEADKLEKGPTMRPYLPKTMLEAYGLV